MTIEVVLIRHGEASWDASSDMERGLTAKGREAVIAASHWLKEHGWEPQQIWVSPYRRAQQTAELICEGGSLSPRTIASLGPDTAIKELEATLSTFDQQRLLLIGHNPLLSHAIARWHEGRPESYWGLEPASMALLQGEVFAPGTVELQWLRHFPNYDHNGR